MLIFFNGTFCYDLGVLLHSSVVCGFLDLADIPCTGLLEVDLSSRYQFFLPSLVWDCVQRTSTRRGEGGFKIVDENGHRGRGGSGRMDVHFSGHPKYKGEQKSITFDTSK